jgi:hypothetical protein
MKEDTERNKDNGNYPYEKLYQLPGQPEPARLCRVIETSEQSLAEIWPVRGDPKSR